jgi:hypothetical protein
LSGAASSVRWRSGVFSAFGAFQPSRGIAGDPVPCPQLAGEAIDVTQHPTWQGDQHIPARSVTRLDRPEPLSIELRLHPSHVVCSARSFHRLLIGLRKSRATRRKRTGFPTARSSGRRRRQRPVPRKSPRGAAGRSSSCAASGARPLVEILIVMSGTGQTENGRSG